MTARSLYEHREAIVAALRPLMPERVTVDSHHGRVDLQEIARNSLPAPCVLIALLDFTDDDGLLPHGATGITAYIVTKDGKAGTRDELNLVLGGLLIAICKTRALVTGADARAPEKPAYRNLYSAPIGSTGLTLGSVSWSQWLDLAMPEEGVDARAVAFEQLHVNYDFAPADAAIDNQQDITISQESP